MSLTEAETKRLEELTAWKEKEDAVAAERQSKLDERSDLLYKRQRLETQWQDKWMALFLFLAICGSEYEGKQALIAVSLVVALIFYSRQQALPAFLLRT